MTDRPALSYRELRKHDHLARKNDIQENILRIEEGWASRYYVLPDGRRAITSVFLPGDYCEPQWLLSGKADLPIVALTRIKARLIPLAHIHGRCEHGVKELLGSMLTMHRRQTDAIVSLGRKSALERVVALLGELFMRLDAAGQVVGDRCTIPLTQQEIADMLGLTPVHVNRVLRDLRNRRIVRLTNRTLRLLNPEAFGLSLSASSNAGTHSRVCGVRTRLDQVAA
ncbi:Crp/Fnr family transcriptional regulator [Novosphingobium kaempferiae]|uniref:Crp/Fnr family transcriptional regulator n=1 Tax=Novosphingobium kaempferiae TaxID=2896849 RepID=UPI001E4DF8FC|nr:Crp/Fnr family transcriptional regulator [Novosphingobium kaempferiae]